MFSRLKRFFSPAAQSGSRLRLQLQRYCNELPHLSDRNDHQKCLSVLASVLEFGFCDRSPEPGLARYTNDTCLFELACYTLASTDFWTFNNDPEKRPKIQQILFSQLDAICSRSGFLPVDAAFPIANDRVSVYGRIASLSSGLEGMHLRLNQALKQASSHVEPIANIDEEPPIFGDPFESLLVAKAIAKWEIQRLPNMEALLCSIS